MKRVPADPSRDHRAEIGTLVPGLGSSPRRRPDNVEVRGTTMKRQRTPLRQISYEEWQYQQQRRAVKQGVLNAFGTVMLWSLVAACVLVSLLALLMGGL